MLLFTGCHLYAQTKAQVERINFFPDSKAFLHVSYQYETIQMTTPQNSVQTKQVHSFINLLALSLGHIVFPRLILGARGFFEEASENAVLYGIPLKRRFNGYGFKEPEMFLIYRIRPQELDQGLFDLNLSFTPELGAREVGRPNSRRLNGRSIFHGNLSHGLWEEQWEFKTSLGVIYYGEGEERNGFTNEKYDLESFYTFHFFFESQYQINPWAYVFGSIGVEYKGTEDIRGRNEGEVQIQSGTGSVFQIGIKKPLDQSSVVELSYLLKRSDYFVRGSSQNLEGKRTHDEVKLSYVLGF